MFFKDENRELPNLIEDVEIVINDQEIEAIVSKAEANWNDIKNPTYSAAAAVIIDENIESQPACLKAMDTTPQASMPEEFNDDHLLVSINASLSSRSFAESLGDHAAISSFKMAIGSVVADDIELCDELFTSAPVDEPDSEFVVKSFKGTSRTISAQDLSKVWKIKVRDA